MFNVSYNNESCLEYGIIPVRRPNIPAPEEKVEEVEIPGRNGVLIISEKLYESISILIEFNFMSKPNRWGETYRKAKKWLSGNGELWFSDDHDVYFKVLYCKVTDTERTSRRIGNFTAEFICDPYTYYKSGKNEIELEHVIYNPGVTCEPVYRITGEGLCTLTVNGYQFTANVGQEIIIDSNRMISYKTDGQSVNTDVAGDYSKLWMNAGENTLSATNGFNVRITPEWREI